jgi:hypothetical protein
VVYRRRAGRFAVRLRAVEILAVAGPIKSRAVRVEWWPVHRLIAGTAPPGGVPAAVTEADEDFGWVRGRGLPLCGPDWRVSGVVRSAVLRLAR